LSELYTPHAAISAEQAKPKPFVIIIALLVLVTAGCATQRLLIIPPGPNFQISYSGAISGNYSGDAELVPCYQVFDYPPKAVIWFGDDQTASYITLDLRVDTSPGTYPMSSDPLWGHLISGRISQAEHDFFFGPLSLISGRVTIKSFPHGPGQPVRGSFEASIRDDLEQIWEIKGQFDFISGSDAPYDCMN
jgi:hypothetical protein